MDEEAMGKIIKKVRRMKGWNQERLSNLCAISRTQITNIETGKSRITWNLLLSISEALEFPFQLFAIESQYLLEHEWGAISCMKNNAIKRCLNGLVGEKGKGG